MTPEQLARWRTDLGLTHRAAAEALGIALVSYQEIERGTRFANSKPAPIDRRTALACAAIRAGLVPEGE